MPLSDDVLEPWSRLITLRVLGRRVEVPEGNTVLRQLQYLSPEVASGRYCWNGECRECEVRFRRGNGPEMIGLACRMRGVGGMEITGLAGELRHNLSEFLAAAPGGDHAD